MAKLSKLQKKWVQDYYGDDDHLENFISLLISLKVLKKKDALDISNDIRKNVYTWVSQEIARKARHAAQYEEKQTYGPAPRSIKPTKARSRY